MVTVGEHPNVLSLIGACTKAGNFQLIFIDVLRAVSFPLSSFFVMINSQLCNTNSSTLECNFCLRTLIFNFVAIFRASIGDCHFGPKWLFVGPTEEE